MYLFSLKESASPWPKFDKAVSELHDWLDTLSEMMKTEKTVLGDSEDMDGLLEKQKVRNDFMAIRGEEMWEEEDNHSSVFFSRILFFLPHPHPLIRLLRRLVA